MLIKKRLLLLILISTVSLFSASQTDIFFDDMENGTSNWVTNDTSSWGITTNQENWENENFLIPSPTHFLSDSPDGNYSNDINSYAEIKDAIDLSSFANQEVTLSFGAAFDIEEDYDHAYLDFSKDNGATWQQIVDYTNLNTYWGDYNYTITSEYKTANFKFRFYLTSDESTTYNGWIIDDVRVSTYGELPTRTFSIHEEDGVTVDTFEINGTYAEHIVLNSGTLIINENTTILGSFVQNGGILNINGDSISIQDDVNITGGVLNVNDGNLSIKGRLLHKEGVVHIKGGRVEVFGDYLIETLEDNGSFSVSQGWLNMDTENSYLLVHGDFVMHNDNPNSFLTEGTLEVRGDFSVEGDGNAYFRGDGNHKVLLVGDEKQIVSFDNPIGSYFNILELDNLSDEGVEFGSGIKTIQSFLPHNTLFQFAEYSNLNIEGFVLEEDTSLNGNFSYVGGSLDLNGHKLLITGSLDFENSTLNLNGGSLDITEDLYLSSDMLIEGNLTIDGDLIQSSGALSVRGRVEVFGDYLMETLEDNGSFTVSQGWLNMDTENSYLLVHRDFVMHNDNPNSFLSEGTLEVRGDFYVEGDGNAYFRGDGNHKVLLAGDEKQIVSFDNPIGSYFNILEFDNLSAEGVEFVSDIKITKLFDHHQKPFILTETQVDSNFNDYDTDGVKDHLDEFPTDITLWQTDSDGDGISDDREIALGLNPNSNDSDGDGILDGVEIGDVNNPTDTDNDNIIDALDEDSDDDGVSDEDERLAGTDPQDDTDYPNVGGSTETITVSLQQGWNTLNILAPLTIAELNNEIGADNILIIQGANQPSSYRILFANQDRAFLNSFDQIALGQAYSIKLLNDVEFNYEKEVFSETKNIILKKGWNHITPFSTLTLEQIRGEVGADNLLIIQGTTVNSTYQKIFVDQGNANQNSFSSFELNQAYWIKVENETSLTFSF